MTIFLNLYIIFYIITLIYIQFLLKNLLITSNNFNSLPFLISYISKFSKVKTLLLTLFFSLTGIPPFFFFFFKFNYIINLLYNFNIFFIFLIFILLFLNMLYYIQIFLHKNFKFKINTAKIVIKKKKNMNFNTLVFIVFFLIFSIFSTFFFSDIFIILYLIYKWQHLIKE